MINLENKAASSFRLSTRVLLLSLSHGLEHLYTVALPPLFLLIQAEFALSYTELGILVSLRALSGFLQPFAGIYVDRWGARLLLAWSFSVMAASFIGMAFSPTFLVLLVFQALQGVGSVVVHPASFPLVARLRGEQPLGRSMAFHSFSGFLGTTVGLFIIAMSGAFFGWKLTLALLSLPGFFVTLLLLRTDFSSPAIEPTQGGKNISKNDAAEEPSAGKVNRKESGFQSKFALWPLLILALSGTFQGMFTRSLTSFLPTFLSSTYGFSIAMAGSLTAIMYVGGLAGLLAGGELADRTDRVYLIAFLGGLGAIMMFFLSWFIFPWIILITILIIVGFLQYFSTPARLSLISDISPTGAEGRVFGITFGLSFTGGAVASPIIGFLTDVFNIRVAFIFLSLMAILMMFTILFLKKWGFGRIKSDKVQVNI